MSRQVELRCPKNSRRLFGKVTVEGDPRMAQFEVGCRDCRGPRDALVLHVFDGTGQCLDTFTIGR